MFLAFFFSKFLTKHFPFSSVINLNKFVNGDTTATLPNLLYSYVVKFFSFPVYYHVTVRIDENNFLNYQRFRTPLFITQTINCLTSSTNRLKTVTSPRTIIVFVLAMEITPGSPNFENPDFWILKFEIRHLL